MADRYDDLASKIMAALEAEGIAIGRDRTEKFRLAIERKVDVEQLPSAEQIIAKVLRDEGL